MQNLKKKKYHFFFEFTWFLDKIYNYFFVSSPKPWDSFPYRSQVIADLSVDNLRIINSTRPKIRVQEEAFDFGGRLISQMFDPNFEPTQHEELTFGFISNCISDSDVEVDVLTLALTSMSQIP